MKKHRIQSNRQLIAILLSAVHIPTTFARYASRHAAHWMVAIIASDILIFMSLVMPGALGESSFVRCLTVLASNGFFCVGVAINAASEGTGSQHSGQDQMEIAWRNKLSSFFWYAANSTYPFCVQETFAFCSVSHLSSCISPEYRQVFLRFLSL